MTILWRRFINDEALSIILKISQKLLKSTKIYLKFCKTINTSLMIFFA